MYARTFKIVLLLVIAALVIPAALAQWKSVGPEGGDVRAFAYDPHNPDYILLGTSSGLLYRSENGGASWSLFAHLGPGDHYVLDNISFDPHDSKTVYVAAWSVDEQNNGDLFKSKDGGKSWKLVPGMRGRSIRAFAIADSNPKILTAGALEGVFRSFDGGDSWQQISPVNHPDIKNIESIAVDSKDPNIIYAGTWHLPWKTSDGGKTWSNIKQGVIDDSDVFSIIIDHSNPDTVYASACSGIYKSDSAGALFRKIQGIPGSARRTRVLQQDPVNPNVVYAGTTEGLWKTIDGGKTFKRISPANFIVNDVFVDPRNPSKLLVATDRNGVVASNDGGQTFRASNTGYSHRQVSSLLIDSREPNVIYAAVLNDKEFGGVFVSRNSGESWSQISSGLDGRDVFNLAQNEDGTIVAGTNGGVFVLDSVSRTWRPANTIVTWKAQPQPKPRKLKSGKVIPAKAVPPVAVKSVLNARVSRLDVSGKRWVAATTRGVYVSNDAGKSWSGGPVFGETQFVAADSSNGTLAAVTTNRLFVSKNDGQSWEKASMPAYVSVVYGMAYSPDGTLWLATREGAFRSNDGAHTWVHALEGLPSKAVMNIVVDNRENRLLATAKDSSVVYESRDNGKSWHATPDAGMYLRGAYNLRGKVIAASAYNGLLLLDRPVKSSAQTRGEELPPAGGGRD